MTIKQNVKKKIWFYALFISYSCLRGCVCVHVISQIFLLCFIVHCWSKVRKAVNKNSLLINSSAFKRSAISHIDSVRTHVEPFHSHWETLQIEILRVFVPEPQSGLCSHKVYKAEGPGFESRLRRDFFGVESYQWLKNWHSSGYPARRRAL